MPPIIEEALNKAALRLKEAGAASPRLDAELLLAEALGMNQTQLILRANNALDEAASAQFHTMIQRRLRREPIAYILGHKEFWGREFLVNQHVLIPRPETELLVESALEWIRPRTNSSEFRVPSSEFQLPKLPGAPNAERGTQNAESGRRNAERGTRNAELSILDLGTGSGAIGLTLAAEIPEAHVVCSDLSAAALNVARENAGRLGLADIDTGRIAFIQSDIFSTVSGEFDLIVSNPPYVGEKEREALMPDVRDYEPALALFSGTEGDEFIKRMLAEAPDHLLPGGALIFEIGYAQGEKAQDLIRSNSRWKAPKLLRDGAGHPRVIVVERG
ncbi:MAG: peptide chain release factor N(5)-glutamine methyltransferase [Candidatus Sumerlaeota bacterium]|nr:peptide chain release factor N(5)-glutamine methyltransferase [Candidatus Sumerlaeota bacterium]